MCNGVKVGNHYMYASTVFHPYIMGCFGPGGESPKLYQECSANPRLCDVKYEGVKSKANESETDSIASSAKSLQIFGHSFTVLILGIVSVFADGLLSL